ncbi:MAG: tetratricopeptide repeat protein [Bacteroidia bacterium]
MENRIENNEDLIRSIDEINDKIWNIRGNTLDLDADPIKLGMEAYEKAISINYLMGIARGQLNQGMAAFIIQHNPPAAITKINEAINSFIQLGDKKWVANARLTLAIIYNSTGQSEPALYNTLKGVDFYENEPVDDLDKAMAYYVTGTVFKDLKKYKESEQYYKKGLATDNMESTSWGGRIFTSLANIYTEEGNYDEAIKMSLKGLEVLVAQKNIIGESRALNDLGNIYKRKKDYEQALDYYFRSLKIREESDLNQFAFSSLTEISSVYKETREYQKAIDYLIRAGKIAVQINQPVKEAQINREIGSIYRSMDQFKDALDYTEKYLEIITGIHAQEKAAKIDNLQNDLLLEKEQEIERLRNVELKEAYNLITEKNKEITDSIHYARRIQKALLAPDYLLNENLGEHFILYKPKDIVSGDFYWACSVNSEQNTDGSSVPSTSNGQLFYLAVCDSTGHGVPGAFMSLLNITYLNEAINEKKIHEPHLIFNHARERLVSAISQDGGRDGMDGVLLCFDKQNNKITYSAANNGPILRKENKIIVLPADKMPVGKDEKTASFTLHSIDVKKGDMIYLVTDGYADQFGGPKGKKFRYKQLEEALQSVSDLPVEEQREILDKRFEDWKGQLEQVDDVLIIGIKV